ncbi:MULTISPECIES: DUF1120 domain-containing protein [Pseudomonas]|uniref:Protein GltF n=1 Tax=Pseudomonas fluorescens TaxID=294 RepID=A0A5E6VGJ9_PSEFL|nr:MULTISPECIES: DUF1120 domain-containing protein [Pseudomonas]VVN16850.1 Protein GltF [Pseudomonas fluorescens]
MKLALTRVCMLLGLTSVGAIASTTEVSLTGTLSPSACTPSLSANGNIDYGLLVIDDLESQGPDYYKLPEKDIAFTINCASPTVFAVKPSDNRFPSSSSELSFHFGLGLHNEAPIGYYTMRFSASTIELDGREGYPASSRDFGQSWSGATGGYFGDTNKDSGLRHAYTHFPTSDPAPKPATRVSVKLFVSGFLSRQLPINGAVHLDGSTTLEIVYL